jgi:hypothetical protein
MIPNASDNPLSSLSEYERAQCAALARWLDASAVTGTLGLFAAAVAALWMALGSEINAIESSAIITAALALVLTPIERIYALRLRFDRGLFADLADGRLPSLAALDDALAALGLRRTMSSSRPLGDRIRGTQRLWRTHAVVVAAQVLLCLLAVTLRL